MPAKKTNQRTRRANPVKQAIVIGLSKARAAGVPIPGVRAKRVSKPAAKSARTSAAKRSVARATISKSTTAKRRPAQGRPAAQRSKTRSAVSVRGLSRQARPSVRVRRSQVKRAVIRKSA